MSLAASMGQRDEAVEALMACGATRAEAEAAVREALDTFRLRESE